MDDDLFMTPTLRHEEGESDVESLDLTQDTQLSAMTGPDRSLDFFVDNDLSEEVLISMGIDIAEIRAQKALEERIKQEKEQEEYARQIQEELDREMAANRISSPASSQQPASSQPSPSSQPSSSQAPPQPSPQVAQPSQPAPSLQPTSQQPLTMPRPLMSGASSTPQRVLPSGIKREAPLTMADKNTLKRMAISGPNGSPNGHNVYRNGQPCSSSSSSSSPFATPQYRPIASSSSSAAASSSSAVASSSSAGASSSSSSLTGTINALSDVLYIDDDDDLIDLTRDYHIDVSSDEEHTTDEEENMNNDDMQALLRQVELVNQQRRAEARYGIPMPGLFGQGKYDPRRNLPPAIAANMPRLSSMGHGGQWTTAKQNDELRKFLATIDMDPDIPPEQRVGTPDDLVIQLLEHQKIGLQWMSKQENSINKGGLLADDMGLGKTIQSLALMVSRRCTDPAPERLLVAADLERSKSRLEPVKVKTTLIVCPIALMEQWAIEVQQKTKNLSVYIYHGSSRHRSVEYLAQFDVVLTSYSIVGAEIAPDMTKLAGPLPKMIFHRVILDEAHNIKNRNTKAAKACFEIEAEYRWCLTATPIQNQVEDLFSLIHFLRIRPYCDWTEFRLEVAQPIKKDATRAMQKLQVIVKGICLRRSKKAMIDGRPIINLPERTVNFTHVDFTEDERHFYDILDKNVQNRFNKYLEAGTVMSNYSNVLLLLLRLRQACLHPSLTTIEKPEESKRQEELNLELARQINERVLHRLMEAKEELKSAECPICMDAADQPQIIVHCGHILCRECLYTFINSSTDYNNTKTCPQCRGELEPAKILPVEAFLKEHCPELADAPPEMSDEEVLEKAQSYLSSKKIDTMLEILQETDEESNGQDKTIIFSQFTSFLDLIEVPIKQRGYKYGRYDGKMSLSVRNKTIQEFMTDPNMKLLLVSTKCGSLGLNLTVANRVILMDIWWNPALENQAIDRVHRIGQMKDVIVHRLFINDTVEDRILQLQKKKQGISDGALGEGTLKVSRLGFNEMLYLFRGGNVPT